MNNDVKLGTFDSISGALKQLRPLLNKITQASSLVELSESIFEVLKKDFDFKSTGFYFINPKTKKLELLLAQGLTDEEKHIAETTAMERHPGWVIKNKKTYQSHGLAEEYTTDFQKRLNLVSRIYCPVLFKNECIGTIGVAASEANAFNDNHVAFIEFLAQMAAVAYENIVNFEELQRNKERMDLAIDSLKFGIWDWNLETNILFWDDFMYQLYEVKKENFTGAYEAFEKTLHPEDAKRVQGELQECFKNKLNFKSDFRVVTQSGKIKRISASAKCIFSIEGKILRLVGANWDITEAKEQEIKLMQASKMSSLGEMSSGIAHEINNPLTIITGNLFKARRELDMPTIKKEEILQSINTIERTVNRIVKIISGLRNFSRDASNDTFEMKSVKSMIEETLTFCGNRFIGQGIKIDWESVSDEVEIECCPSQIEQVFLNLLNNAYDAVLENQDKWVKIELKDEGDSVSLLITDSGKGIPAEIRSKILEPFFTTKPVGKGTGLGMSISLGIVKSHKGQLSLDENCPNTRFVMTLPKKQSP